MSTTYYKSDFYEAKLRVEDDKAFLKQNGEEKEMTLDSNTVTDIMAANQRISKEEYSKSD